MAHVVFQLCFVTSFFMAKTEAFFAQPGEAASKRGQTPPPTFLEAPQEIHYFVTRKQPANLTWVATDVCKMQIKCNKEKFRDGNNRVCKQTCRECKTRTRTKIVKVKDFPEGVRSMTCQCKVWGTKVIKTEKIIVEKAYLLSDNSKQSNPPDSTPAHGKSETRTHSDGDISTPPSLPETGSCVPYNGSVCYNFLNGESIYVRSLEKLENIERKVSRAYPEFSEISERCRPFVRPLLCHYEFPSCDSSSSVPKPMQICYEECEILRTSICPEETLQQVSFPECSSLPRADTAEGKNCIKLNVNKTKTAKSQNSPNSPTSPKSPKPEKPTPEKGKAGKEQGKKGKKLFIILLLFALPLAVYIYKKRFSHFTQVDQNVREDIGAEPTTERRGFIQENSPPSFDASAVLSQQRYNVEPLGAGATGENSSVRFHERGDLMIYNNYNRVATVNLNTQLNTVNTNMHTTNNYNVELEQNGGMTVEDIE